MNQHAILAAIIDQNLITLESELKGARTEAEVYALLSTPSQHDPLSNRFNSLNQSFNLCPFHYALYTKNQRLIDLLKKFMTPVHVTQLEYEYNTMAIPVSSYLHSLELQPLNLRIKLTREQVENKQRLQHGFTEVKNTTDRWVIYDTKANIPHITKTLNSGATRRRPGKNELNAEAIQNKRWGKSRLSCAIINVFLDQYYNNIKSFKTNAINTCSINLMLSRETGDFSNSIDANLFYPKIDGQRTFKAGAYQEAVKQQLLTILKAQIYMGTEVLCTPIIGGGLFLNALTREEQNEARALIITAYIDALKTLSDLYPKMPLKEVVFCVPQGADGMYTMLQNSLRSCSNNAGKVQLSLTDAGFLDAARLIDEKYGAKTGILIPGHDCDIGGGYSTCIDKDTGAPADETVSLTSDAVLKMANVDSGNTVVRDEWISLEELTKACSRHYSSVTSIAGLGVFGPDKTKRGSDSPVSQNLNSFSNN